MRRLESIDPNHRITVASFLEQVDTLANNLKGESFGQLLCPVLFEVIIMWRELLNNLCAFSILAPVVRKLDNSRSIYRINLNPLDSDLSGG